MFYYAILLLLLFFVFLIGEFFVPSAGIIGILALVCAVGSISCAFAHSTLMGGTTAAIVFSSTPAILFFMIRMWPHTPIGRRILNRRPGQADAPAPERTMGDGTPISELVGRIGVARSDLLPSGRVLINKQKVDAISTGMAIDKGTEVVVVKTVAGKIHVRKATEKEVAAAAFETLPVDQSVQESGESPRASGQMSGEAAAGSGSAIVSEHESTAPKAESPFESFDLDSLE